MKRDRFELICSPGTLRPEELRYQLAGSAIERRVQFLDYRPLPPNLQVPVRRLVLGHDGRRLMEMEVVHMQFRLDIPAARFRPPVRAGVAMPR